MIPNLLAWVAQTTILVAVAVLSPMLLRVRNPRVDLLLSQGVLLAMLLLPFLQPWTVPSAPAGPLLAIEPSARAPKRSAPAQPLPLPQPEAVLIGGVVLRLAWLAAGLARLLRYRRSAQPVAPDIEAEDLTAILFT
ncbi:MAG: hypothetical protein SGI92_23155 [Bryobacteraceae bacterium]|nr:hypothetical protein [Bryobacteraceae bacterium]